MAASCSATPMPRGEATDRANPNGSLANIAGICNEARNVVGLMPHPERACEAAVGSTDGLVLFESVVHALSDRAELQPMPVSAAADVSAARLAT